MELVISEKPSVAQALAKALGAGERCDGYLKGGGYIISWCVGHLVEPAMPEAYDEAYSHWSYDTLPIMPKEWKYVVKKDTQEQFAVLKRLLHDKEISSVICATDAGREGELIFRLVYEQAGCKKPFKRLWISSMEESAIRDGFASLKPGSDYDDLYRSALCRQQADWLVGLNGTRLFTVLYGRTLKVGRVQTPTLAMLAEREEAIRRFQKQPFYTVRLAEEGVEAVSEKFPDRAKAEELAVRCAGAVAKVLNVQTEEKSVSPPRLYDLTTLQRDANRIFGFTAKQTLDCTQSLYEKKLCTYPRTDSQYLSDDMEQTAKNVLTAAGSIFPYLKGTDAQQADIKRVMDSGRVSDHHAIIPTVEIGRISQSELSEGEWKVLSLLAVRVAAATAQKHQYRSVKAQIECAGSIFTASGKTVVCEGFKAYEAALRRQFKVAAEKGDDGNAAPLPEVTEGMVLSGVEATVSEGFTQAPKRFTEDSLLSAMERAGAEDMGDDVERKGLGTPATRADVIEKLVHDGFVKREKKLLIPTEDGIKLISVLPESVKSPKLTADWENALALVAKGGYPSEQFMGGIRELVTDLVQTYHEAGVEAKKMFGSKDALGKCPHCGGDVLKGRFGFYCSEKCGMSLGRAFGKELSEKQVKDLLEGKKILVKGLKSKKGGNYDAYLIPDGVEPYSYTKKDGTEADGFQYKFQMEFTKNKKGDR